MSKNKWLYFLRQVGYVFLLPAFFLLHGYNENFALITADALSTLFFQYYLITIIVVGLSWLAFRKEFKAALFSFIVLCIFFFFGAFHDFSKRFFGEFFVSYSFLLPVIFTGLVVAFLLIGRKRTYPEKSVRFLNFLFLFLFILETISLINNWLTSKQQSNDLAGSKAFIGSLNNQSSNSPDIFFVVLDGYTSSNCLLQQFNYDNSELDTLLKRKGFFTSANSRSNYNITPFSLSSTMNGNYLNEELKHTPVTSKVFSQAMETFSENSLMHFLANNGYTVKNYGCFDHAIAKTTMKPYFDNWDLDLIDNQTLYSRIKRDIGWNFVLNQNWPKIDFLVQQAKDYKAYHILKNKQNWKFLLKEMRTSAIKPRFVYAHLMLPHEPYYVDKTGNPVSDSVFNHLDPKQGYLNQITYVNSLLGELIKSSDSDSSRPRVIIVEGDHGFRHYDKSVSEDKVFMNLNTYFFSDKDYSMLYDGISPVNSFRVVFNKYFNQHLPLLKDSSIYLREPLQ